MKKPNFDYERQMWRKGFEVVVGVDEVGRGSWAGPVVASACAFAPQIKNLKFKIKNYKVKFKIEELGVNDSKALRSRKRTQLADKIKECSKGWAIGEVKVGVINKVGIGKATQMAMRKALSKLISNIKIRNSKQYQNPNVQNSKSLGFRISDLGFAKTFVLVDAFHIKYLKGIGLKNQKAIVKGDQKSISIASASILAKVYRDNLMRKLAKKHKVYGFGRNKGYGTREHQQAILKYGITGVHRRAFVGTFLAKTKFSGGRKTRSL